jgi:precorrin-2/cobalt-factor-2 C20-methyltransferase
MSGTVWGIGVGPGDPELLTLKAVRLIRAAAVVAYPAPEVGESFARMIAAPYLPGGQEEIAIRMPLGDGQFPKKAIYDAAASAIAGRVADGLDVAVLCEGDPFFYGSFMYLYARLVVSCPVQVVPGVSSLMACAGVAGAPLAARNDVLTVLPAPLPEDELMRRLAVCDAAALIKVGRHLGKLRRVLAALGLLDQARYVERATLGAQRVLPLEAAGETAPYFSMVLVHRRGEAWQ